MGALQHLTCTRPDLVHAVNQVLQFMHALRKSHMEDVKRIEVH